MSYGVGEHVKLGDGREGTVVKHVEQNGFKSMLVRITKSDDKKQIGMTVAATPDGMNYGESHRRTSQQSNTQLTKPKKVRQPKPDQMLDVKNKIEQQMPGLSTQLGKVKNQTTQPNKKPYFKLSASHWVRSEHANAEITIGGHKVVCDVAATPKQQASGLQAYDSIGDGFGLWFPQHDRRVASFHMGQVKFPIDIVFADRGKVVKIVANIKPRAPGSWQAACTDVIEVAGGWCASHRIKIGDTVSVPGTNKRASTYDTSLSELPDMTIFTNGQHEFGFVPSMALWLVRSASGMSWLPHHKFAIQHREALNEIERLIHTQDGGLDARAPVTAEEDKEAGSNSYDLLRTITEADKEGLNEHFNEEPEFIKDPDWAHNKQSSLEGHRMAQENWKVKPQTDKMQPGEIDKRNPLERFKSHDLPDAGTAEGEDNTDLAAGGGLNPGGQAMGWDPENAHLTYGYDINTYDEYEGPAVRAGQKTAEIDTAKTLQSTLTLFDKYPPEWSDPSNGDNTLSEAIVSNDLISNWIDSLGFEEADEEPLREVMFTTKFKQELSDLLVSTGRVANAELLDSELFVYR